MGESTKALCCYFEAGMRRSEHWEALGCNKLNKDRNGKREEKEKIDER